MNRQPQSYPNDTILQVVAKQQKDQVDYRQTTSDMQISQYAAEEIRKNKLLSAEYHADRNEDGSVKVWHHEYPGTARTVAADLKCCSCQYPTRMGLPCRHIMAARHHLLMPRVTLGENFAVRWISSIRSGLLATLPRSVQVGSSRPPLVQPETDRRTAFNLECHRRLLQLSASATQTKFELYQNQYVLFVEQMNTLLTDAVEGRRTEDGPQDPAEARMRGRPRGSAHQRQPGSLNARH